MDSLGKARGTVVQSEAAMAWSIGSIFVQVVVGCLAGVLLGFIGWLLFKYLPAWRHMMKLKCAYCIIVASGIIIFTTLFKWASNAKYISCLSMGYTLGQLWGINKPANEIKACWFFMQPFLFGTIGAALVFSQLSSADVGKSIVCIILGQIMRFLSVFILSYGPKYTIKERIFMSLAWIPKSTVPATLASVVYG